ncbi:MAG: putative membrane protein [Glaciecola sp.]|jgi:uncharacterized membrane protein
MSLTSNFVVLGILCFLILLGQYIAKTKWGKPIGAALIVILLGALFANLNLIPSASNAIGLYSAIFHYIAPVSIFYLVLGVNLQEIKNAGLPMIGLFLLGSAATVIGVIFSYYLIDPSSSLGEFSSPMAGMIAGTYTGGSINFNAVALHYKVNETGILYAGAIAVDNVITTVWVIATLMIPKVMHSIWPGKKIHAKVSSSTDLKSEHVNDTKDNFQELYYLIPLGFAAFIVTELVALVIPQIPSILTITTIGIILAQLPVFRKLKMARNLGLYLVYLFLVVIGAFCELEAIGQLGDVGITLMLFFGLTIVIHGTIMLTVGRLFFADWQMIAIASQANVGGGTTAMALAESMDRKELIVPSILVGSLGGAIGTYLGFSVAGLL